MEGNESGQRVVGEGLSELNDAEGPAKGAEQALQAGESTKALTRGREKAGVAGAQGATGSWGGGG